MSSYLGLNYDCIELKDGFCIYSENWVFGHCSQDYINEVLKCIDFTKPEIYFNAIFYILNNKTTTSHDDFINLDNKHIDCYNNFCKALFFIKCGIKIGEFESDNSHEILAQNELLAKHFDSYYESIELYVNYKSDITVLGFSKSDNIFGDQKTIDFFLNVMLISYFITTKRFYENQYNDDYFSIDNIWFPDGDRLTVYFTPFALLNKKFVKKTFNSNAISCLDIFFRSKNVIIYEGNKSEVDYNIEIEVFWNGKTYVVERPIENPLYYLNGYLQEILALNYLNFLFKNHILTFRLK